MHTARTGILLAALILCITAAAHGEKGVSRIRVEGAIGPATAGYIARAIETATEKKAVCLIIELDTPGGLLDSTKKIVQKMLASSLPIVVYVSPEGASAGSAGCFITLAAHVAAMAPATNIGAAHPVALGGAVLDETMNEKLVSYASSYIESIAEKRNRNVEWAISSVRESASITEKKALEENVIEIIAEDTADLLRQLDGREIDGVTLQTEGAKVEDIPMTLRERVFQMLWRPEVMFILMLVAVYGIIGELSNPGAIIPGATGLIALILSLYMASVLPVNVAGLALVGLAIALFIAEAFTPTTGILTTAGIVSFFIGSLMLFDTRELAFRLPLGYIITGTLLTAAFFIFVVTAGLRAQYLPAKTGASSMVGRHAKTVEPIGHEEGGRVLIDGEYWNAICEEPLAAGAKVEIVSIDGLTLTVKPVATDATTHSQSA